MTLFYDILTQQIKKMKQFLLNDTAINGLTVFSYRVTVLDFICLT